MAPDAATDGLAAAIRGLSIDDAQRQPSSPTKTQKISLLQAMNEKLAKRPTKRRGRGTFSQPRPISAAATVARDPSKAFLLESRSEVMGVFSTLELATEVARRCGATNRRLSRANDDGIREYGDLIRILPKRIERSEALDDARTETIPKISANDEVTSDGVKSAVRAGSSERQAIKKAFKGKKEETSIDKEKVRIELDDEKEGKEHIDMKQGTMTHEKRDVNSPNNRPVRDPKGYPKSVYLALDGSLCIGIFVEKSRAWEACTKHKTQMTYTVALKNQKQWVDKDLMPHLQGNIGGSGFHHWNVKLYVIDEMDKDTRGQVVGERRRW